MRVSQHWYQGTADAVYQNIYSIGSEQSSYVFILSGDHIYKMNYQKMLEQHVAAGADVTVATIEMEPEAAARQFGIIETDEHWRIIGFEEKPANPKSSRVHPDKMNASMGIYLFNTQLLVPILIADAEDPNVVARFRTKIFFRGSSRSIACLLTTSSTKIKKKLRIGGTWERSMPTTRRIWIWFPFRRSSIFTIRAGRCTRGSSSIRRRNLCSPTRKAPARRVDSIVAGGSIVSGGRVSKSVLGYDVRVNSYQRSRRFDRLQSREYRPALPIRRAIIDRHVDLPEGTMIGYDREADRAALFRVRRWRGDCCSRRIHDRRAGIIIMMCEC